MTDERSTGFIGAGNMATAMIKGLIESGVYGKGQLGASDKDSSALKRMAERFGVESYGSSNELVQRCSTVVLSIKPQNMKDVLEEVRDGIKDDHLIISIAAGIPVRMIQGILKRDVPIIRVMPNTPALVQKGMSALAAGQFATPEHMATARTIFDAVGDTVEVEESMMDAVTALSGSGPGYIFRMMECMVDAGVGVGLERKTTLSLVIQTFLGSAHLAKSSEHSLSYLREMVTSPGGTTEAGLGVFDKMGLAETVRKAVEAACNRSVELGKSN
jgi:pyrroline-5-carboxylate reductase